MKTGLVLWSLDVCVARMLSIGGWRINRKVWSLLSGKINKDLFQSGLADGVMLDLQEALVGLQNSEQIRQALPTLLYMIFQ